MLFNSLLMYCIICIYCGMCHDRLVFGVRVLDECGLVWFGLVRESQGAEWQRLR